MVDGKAIHLTRRAVLPLLGAGAGIGALVARAAVTPAAGAEDAGWPSWAPTRADLYAQFRDWRARGKDIRQFGAKLDGQNDDTDALEKAIAAGTAVLLIPAGTLRLTRAITLTNPIAILGAGDVSVVRWEGRQRDPFTAMPANKDPATFLTGVHIDSIRLVRPAPLPSNGTILRAMNLRRVSVTRCSTDRFGALLVGHLRAPPRDDRKEVHDPALDAGFSANGDDLNEDILAYDNRVDGGAYMSQILRVNFARRIAAVGNSGRFANISWWGGGARINQGGAPQFLRRARDLYITHNVVHGANGGIYGNNGDGIIVAHNQVSDMLDVGIDFEGCFNALAHDNVVKNAANFGLATFYAARNIVFRDNKVYQDGSAAQLPAVYGKSYGKGTGRALFALRSAGFANSPAVDVTFSGNRFVWGGKTGTGNCVPSFFAKLVVDGNTFENVECDLTYRAAGTLAITRNRMGFDRTAATPLRALGENAAQATITDNEIRVTAPQHDGSAAIVDTAPPAGPHRVEIARNRVIDGGARGAALPIVLLGAGGRVSVTGNTVSAVYAANAPGAITGNRKSGGGPATLGAPPAAFTAIISEPSEPAAPAPADPAP